MKTHTARLRRHLSYANVMASIAVFLALGGVGYAATSINGNKIVKASIGAGKLKNGTLTSKQVKADGLTGGVIDESTLSIVPQAQAAVSASSAETAKSATTAGSANTANTATTATTADTLDGLTAEDLEVSCPSETELFGGMCWDDAPRSAHTWIGASLECGEAGGRLPTLSELVAYLAHEVGEQFPGDSAWSSEVVDVQAGAAVAVGVDDSGVVSSPTGNHGFRCLFYRAN